jgi:hypothetical protein
LASLYCRSAKFAARKLRLAAIFFLSLAVFQIASREVACAKENEDQYGISSSVSGSQTEEESEDSGSDGVQRVTAYGYSGAVVSTDAFVSGQASAGALRHAAEISIQRGNYDKAIKFIRLSIQKQYDDNDSHRVYAEALEKKLSTQVDRDPELFNQCIKEWLLVLRQEVGDEKLSYHGLSIPGLGKFFEDEDFAIPAKQHIKTLTGMVPKVWETDNQFLKKVGKQDSSEVSGRLLKNSDENSGKRQDDSLDKSLEKKSDEKSNKN